MSGLKKDWCPGDRAEYKSSRANGQWISTKVVEVSADQKKVLLQCHLRANSWLYLRDGKVRPVLEPEEASRSPLLHSAPASSKSRPDLQACAAPARRPGRPAVAPVPSPARSPRPREPGCDEIMLSRDEANAFRKKLSGFKTSTGASLTLGRCPRTPVECTAEGKKALANLEAARKGKDARAAVAARKELEHLKKRRTEEAEKDRRRIVKEKEKEKARLSKEKHAADKGHYARQSHDRDAGRSSHRVEKKAREPRVEMNDLFSEDNSAASDSSSARAKKKKKKEKDDSPVRRHSREEVARTHSSHPGPESHKRTRSSVAELAPETPDFSEPPAKKAKPKVKSQAKPKPAPPPAAQLAAPAPAPVAAPAPTGPPPLGKQGKQELQNKIDLLEDDFLETVLRFLEADLGGQDDDNINLDLDNLPPLRQQQLVKVVNEELGKQQARQDAHARGERTPPESPVFDIGRDILTPLQRFQAAAMEPPMSPMILEASAVAQGKGQVPFPTPTPFPTPSECGDDQAERPHIGEAVAKLKCPSAAASPAGRSVASGQSVGKLMEDTISQAVRKAVKVTPELTESKTPRHQPASSPKNGAVSPTFSANDSMLNILNEDDLDELANGLPGKATDDDAADARCVASGTVISGTSV